MKIWRRFANNIRAIVTNDLRIVKILFPSRKEKIKFLVCYFTGCTVFLISGIIFAINSSHPPTLLDIMTVLMLVGLLISSKALKMWEDRASQYIKED